MTLGQRFLLVLALRTYLANALSLKPLTVASGIHKIDEATKILWGWGG